MAIYHLSVKLITRSTGRSATAAAAYRAGEKIHDHRTGQIFDYTRKKDVSYRRIFTPPNCPLWMSDRERLWNEAQNAETRKDAQECRSLEMSLPTELSLSQHIILLERFVHTQLTSKGMVADVVIHDNKVGNPHAHILLTTREINITNDGFGKKNRDWNSKEQLQEWRLAWEKHCNRRLLIAGSKSRIDHRSLKDQGIDRIPTVHVGARSNAMEKRGIASQRKRLNANIKEKNMQNEETKKNFAALSFVGEVAAISKEIAEAKKAKMFISASDSHNHRSYREALFSRTYVPILLELFHGHCTSIDEIQTDIGFAYRINLSTGAVYDYGNQIKLESGSDEEVKIAVKLAKEKGWNGLHISGSAAFKEAVFMEAILSGAFTLNQITGYTPPRCQTTCRVSGVT